MQNKQNNNNKTIHENEYAHTFQCKEDQLTYGLIHLKIHHESIISKDTEKTFTKEKRESLSKPKPKFQKPNITTYKSLLSLGLQAINPNYHL